MPEPSGETFSLPRTGLSVEGRELVVSLRGGKAAERYPLEDILGVEARIRWNPVAIMLAVGGFAFLFVVPVLLGRPRWGAASIVALAFGLLSMRKRYIVVASRRGDIRRPALDPFDECSRFAARLGTMVKGKRKS